MPSCEKLTHVVITQKIALYLQLKSIISLGKKIPEVVQNQQKAEILSSSLLSEC